MLPFSSIDFFILFGSILLFMYVFKPVLKKYIPFQHLLLSVSVFYIVFFFPKPWHLAAFVFFSFGLLWLFSTRLKNIHKLPGSLLIAAPLILIKIQVAVDIVSFAGLSYLTFRTLQVYLDHEYFKEKVKFSTFANFLVFTPTLLIGPIDRYERFKNDLQAGYENLNKQQFLSGWNFMLLGIVQKFVVAETINRFLLPELDPQSKELNQMAGNMYVYSVYLFFDFAGYSSLAMGLGYMLGIKVPENFKQPYLSLNPQDFWKRWHITLGDWLRDYFFRPIYKWLSGFAGLKRSPLLKQNLSLFLTFSLMGAWNGLKANYLVSGAMFGLYSVIHNSHVFYSKKKGRSFFDALHPAAVKGISLFLMINFVCLALYVFSGRMPFIK